MMPYLLAEHKAEEDFWAVLMQSLHRHSFLNYIGVAILIIGLASGEFIYWRGLRSDAAADVQSPYDSKVYEQDVQRNIGVFGLIMDEFSRSMGKLAEPGPMGIAVAVVSVAAAGGCFFAASRLPPE
jgi:hypothetical protein